MAGERSLSTMKEFLPSKVKEQLSINILDGKNQLHIPHITIKFI